MSVFARWPAALRQQPMPLLAVSAAGWTLLALQDTSYAVPALCLSAGASAAAGLIAALTFNPPLWLGLAWLAMLLAMMPPLLAQPLLYLWHRSLRRRRARAIALFVIGYGTVWLAAGIVLTMLAIALDVMSPLSGLALALLIALVWQVTPVKQVCLNRCHSQPPLAAFGLRADADALRYGMTHGIWCAGACWALMLVPLMAGRLHLAAMAAVMLFQVVERMRPGRAPRWGAALPSLAPSARIAAFIRRSA
jgi:predicted metal-binding membrane protein